MINQYLVVQLKRAQSVLRKQGQAHLVDKCFLIMSAMLDTTDPTMAEYDARQLIHLALDGTIHA